MTRIERVLKELSDLWDFYRKVQAAKREEESRLKPVIPNPANGGDPSPDKPESG